MRKTTRFPPPAGSGTSQATEPTDRGKRFVANRGVRSLGTSSVDYLESAACDWTAEEIDFVDWVFNAAPVLKERAAWMALNEGLTNMWDAEQRAPYAQKSMAFIDRITDTLSKKMVRKVKNRWGDEIWPWDRNSLR